MADLAEPLPFEDGAFDVAVASLVMHYLRDWVPALRELRRVAGMVVLSTHHPASDVELSDSGDYFAVELLHDRWTVGGREREVSFWHRPLGAMFAEVAAAGWRTRPGSFRGAVLDSGRWATIRQDSGRDSRRGASLSVMQPEVLGAGDVLGART